MKVIKKYTLLIFIFSTAYFNSFSQASEKGYKVNMEMNADEKGDIEVVATTKYNAQYWDYMKANRTLEPSIMKTTMLRVFPKYKLIDFDIKSDEMERTATVKFKVLGSMKMDDNGKWIADLETKNPDITKISDTKFMLVDEASSQTMKINLPSSASGAKIEKDNFGKAILTYTAPVSGGGMGNIIKYLGILVAAGGAFLFWRSRKLNTVVVDTPQNKNINFNQPKHIDDAVVINPVPDEKLKRPDENKPGQAQY
jgi:hypothetical protein